MKRLFSLRRHHGYERGSRGAIHTFTTVAGSRYLEDDLFKYVFLYRVVDPCLPKDGKINLENMAFYCCDIYE